MTSETSSFDYAFDAFDRAFDYAKQLEDPVRLDLVLAHRRAWERIATPGTWWDGRERVAIAAEARAADDCAFCRRRREALSPFSERGEHDEVSGAVLPAAAIDAVHRIVTDATRLTSSWVDGLASEGVPVTHYVELLSVVVSIRSIDAFHRAMGVGLEPLPEPCSGEPSHERPAAAIKDEAWVPMLPAGRPSGDEADLWAAQTGNVIRAMSLVPEAVRWLKDLSGAHYLDDKAIVDFTRGRGPLSRAQTELIAGRVSALNECFY
jgi:hypothetical protein